MSSTYSAAHLNREGVLHLFKFVYAFAGPTFSDRLSSFVTMHIHIQQCMHARTHAHQSLCMHLLASPVVTSTTAGIALLLPLLENANAVILY